MLVCSGHGKHNSILLANRIGSGVFNVGVNRTYCRSLLCYYAYDFSVSYIIGTS